MSVDAKLAAQAQTAAAAAASGGLSSSSNPSAAASARAPSSSSSNSNTPKVQAQQHGQQSHSHQHAQQHQQLSQSTSSLARSKKEEYLLLSLPSRDSALTANHSHWDAGEEAGFYGSGEDEDNDWTDATMCPPLTNRGNKLAPGARFVRKGRLGGWENREFLDGTGGPPGIKSTFRAGAAGTSAISRPTMDQTDSLLADEVKRPQAGLPGGKDVYPITPNLTFVPSSSTAAARPDREPPAYSFLPGPNSPTSPSALSPRKRKKVYSSYTGLASTSGSTSNHTSAPVRAYLPAPPQNPIELVMSPLVTRTFSPRNNSLEKLALHPTDLIERDLPLLKALTRVVDVLRGTAVAGLDGTLGLPFSNDNEPVIQPDIKDKAVEEVEREAEAEIKSAKEAEAAYLTQKHDKAASGEMEVDKNDAAEDSEAGPSRKRRRTGSMDLDPADPAASNATHATSAPPVNGTAVDAGVGTATVAAAETAGGDMQEDQKPNVSETITKDGQPIVNGTEAVKLEASLKGLPVPSSTAATTISPTVTEETAATAEKEMASNEAVHDKAESGIVAETTTNTEAAAATTTTATEASVTNASVPPVAASVSASRRNSPFSHAGGDDDNESMADTNAEGSTSSAQINPPTRYPASIQRIANPAPYVSSLFVSPNDVLVGIPPGAPNSVPGQPNAPVPGGYQWIDILLPNGVPRFVYRHLPPSVQTQKQQAANAQQAEGSTSGTNAQAGPSGTKTPQTTAAPSSSSTPVSTYPEYRKLTPTEQQEAVHLCTQELTKFLSDTLEYRDRLGEIRDSILGVEKRRKGVWTMARSYAHQLLWEEEQDRVANGM